MDHETQASRVAELHENASKTLGKSILLLSGKGGTGKSNAALNIALALSKMDRRVTLLDTNLQVTDISMLMGFEQKMNFREALYEGKAFHNLLFRDKSGLGVICGGMGFDGVEGIEDAVNDKLTETLYQCRLKEDFLL